MKISMSKGRLLAVLALMVVMHETMLKKRK